MVLPSDVTRYQLDGLQPGTEYRLTLYTLLEGREVATPATVVPTGEGPRGPGQVSRDGRGDVPGHLSCGVLSPVQSCPWAPSQPSRPPSCLGSACECPGAQFPVPPSIASLCAAPRVRQTRQTEQTLKSQPSGSDCTLSASLSTPGALPPPPVSFSIHLPRRP